MLFRSDQMLTNLTAFYRLTLRKSKELIPIKDELEIARLYLEMEKLCHKDNLNWEINAEDGIENFTICKFTLQPFLENSILHGILEKMQRKHIPMERMEEELEDIAGVRIICQFEEDIETVASLIQKRSDMVIKSEKNYLKHIKQSGYRSYHLIIYYTVDTIKGPKKLQAEIQIRTMAMNFWATIEHSLQYKYKGDMPEHVAERLSKAADAINALDHEMSSVRNEIMDAQNSSQMQSNLVKDILINIENLYKIANKREIMKIQDEFLRVFKTKDLQQLKRFHRQLDIISEGYRAQAVYHHV